MNLDSMNLLQRWVSDIFQAQRTFKGRDNKSAVRFFSYVHLTLVTLFFHFYSYSPTEGVITLPAMAHNFCVRKQVPKSWFECYVDYTSRDKVREAVEQHNPNKSELFCYSAFFFFFFPHNSRAKGKGRSADVTYWILQGLWHSPHHHTLFSKLQMDGWGLAGWLHPAMEWSKAQCPSQHWWQVVSFSTVVFSRAAVLLTMGLCPNASPKTQILFRK